MKALIENKKVHLNYELLHEFEAGLGLLGHEVKSIRRRQGSLAGAHITIRGDEAFLLGATIPPYQPANTPDSYDPARNRKLLLSDTVGPDEQNRIDRFTRYILKRHLIKIT